LLDAYVAEHPNLEIVEKLHEASGTHEANERAMAESMKRQFKDKQMTQADFLRLANTWFTGSNLSIYARGLEKNQQNLKYLSSAWDAAKSSARSTSYITYSHSDDGPDGFRIVESAENTARKIDGNARRVINGIYFAENNATALEMRIKEYVQVALYRKEGNADHLRGEIMRLARDIYQKNFADGFDVEPFKWWDVALVTLLCAGGGAAAGFGLKKGREKVTEIMTDRRHSRFQPERRAPY
jgi:hypothetical protein